MTVKTEHEMKKNEDEEEAHQRHEEEEKNASDDPPTSAYSSPPHTLRHSKLPSQPVDSPANLSESSDQNSLSQGPSSVEENFPTTPPESFPVKPPSPSPVTANRTLQTEPIVLVRKMDVEAQEGHVEEGNTVGGEDAGGVGGWGDRRLRPNLSILRRARIENMRKKVFLGCRLCGFVFCLISFSVLAADKNQGWALDSFYRYKEFRYCLAVNVIGFVYSGLQALDLIYLMTSGKSIFRHHFRRYFDFSIDQMLAYLLLSSSSSAATRVDDWQSNWGKDKFPQMASVSVGLSIVAFVAFASTSFISGYALCMYT